MVKCLERSISIAPTTSDLSKQLCHLKISLDKACVLYLERNPHKWEGSFYFEEWI